MAVRIRRRSLIAGAAATAAIPVVGLGDPASATPMAADGGDLAEVRGGSMERLEVRITETQQDLAVPTRGFTADWVFKAGDIVVVQSVQSSSAKELAVVAEPFTQVVRTAKHFEVWIPNTLEGPRLHVISTHG